MKSQKIDALDRRILAHLIVNSRRPIAALAEHLEVNQETLRYRIERLKKRKIIKRSIAYVDTSLLGYTTLLVLFRVHGKESKRMPQFLKKLTENPYITLVAETIGKWDGFCEITVKNFTDAAEIMEKMRNEFNLKSLEYEILLEKKQYTMRARIFEEAYEYSKPLEIQRYPSKNDITIDERDLKLLSLLSRNSDTTLKGLSNRLGTSIVTVKNHMERLRSLGLIKGFSVILDEHRLGFKRITLALNLIEVSERRSSQFLHEILLKKNVLNVIECFGKYNLIVDIYSTDFYGIINLLKKLKKEYPDVFSFYDLLLISEELKREYFPHIIKT